MAIGRNKLIKGMVDGLGGYNETNLTAATYTAAGAISTSDVLIKLNKAAGQAMTFNSKDGVSDRWLIINHQNADTNDKTVTMTGCSIVDTFQPANEYTIATTNAAGETLILYGIDDTHWLIVLNIGSVALS